MNAAEEGVILSGKPMTLSAPWLRALALALFLLAALVALASRCATGICNAATLSGGSAEVSTANMALPLGKRITLAVRNIPTDHALDAALRLAGAGYAKPWYWELPDVPGSRVTYSCHDMPILEVLWSLCRRAYGGKYRAASPFSRSFLPRLAIHAPVDYNGPFLFSLQHIYYDGETSFISRRPKITHYFTLAMAMLIDPTLPVLAVGDGAGVTGGVELNGRRLPLAERTARGPTRAGRHGDDYHDYYQSTISLSFHRPQGAGDRLKVLSGVVPVTVGVRIKKLDFRQLGAAEKQAVGAMQFRVGKLRIVKPGRLFHVPIRVSMSSAFHGKGGPPNLREVVQLLKMGPPATLVDAHGRVVEGHLHTTADGSTPMPPLFLVFRSRTTHIGMPRQLLVPVPTRVKTFNVPFRFRNVPLPPHEAGRTGAKQNLAKTRRDIATVTLASAPSLPNGKLLTVRLRDATAQRAFRRVFRLAGLRGGKALLGLRGQNPRRHWNQGVKGSPPWRYWYNGVLNTWRWNSVSVHTFNKPLIRVLLSLARQTHISPISTDFWRHSCGLGSPGAINPNGPVDCVGAFLFSIRNISYSGWESFSSGQPRRSSEFAVAADLLVDPTIPVLDLPSRITLTAATDSFGHSLLPPAGQSWQVQRPNGNLIGIDPPLRYLQVMGSQLNLLAGRVRLTIATRIRKLVFVKLNQSEEKEVGGTRVSLGKLLGKGRSGYRIRVVFSKSKNTADGGSGPPETGIATALQRGLFCLQLRRKGEDVSAANEFEGTRWFHIPYTYVCHNSPSEPKPTELILKIVTGERVVDVPFRFRNLPLP